MANILFIFMLNRVHSLQSIADSFSQSKSQRVPVYRRKPFFPIKQVFYYTTVGVFGYSVFGFAWEFLLRTFFT